MKNTTRLKIILLLSTMTSISFHSALLGQAGRTAKKSIQERWDFDRIRFDIYKRSGQVIDVIKRYFPHEIDTMLCLGNRALQDEEWHESSDWFETILMAEPNNLKANYGYAVSECEVGMESFMLYPNSFRNSRKHFERIIAIDSTFEETYYQYGVTELYLKKHLHAAELVYNQYLLDPSDDDIHKELFRFYDIMVNNVSFDKAESWLKSRKSKHDEYFLGELYRRNEQFKKADSVYQTLLTDPGDLPLTRILLSLVRYYVQTNQPEKAEEAYWQAVYGISNILEADLLIEDFLPIVNEREYVLLTQTLPIHAIPEAIHLFWLERNPLPSAPTNERLIEHYRRILYAEKHYLYQHYRHPMAKADYLNRFMFPVWYDQNNKYDDRGLIYIRYGPADDQATGVRQYLPMNLSWLYRETPDVPKLIFHFAAAKPGYWTLSLSFTQKEIIEWMLGWDTKYQRLYMGSTDPSIIQELEIERVQMVDDGFRHDRHSWDEKTEVLNMTHIDARFRESAEEECVQFAYAVPLSELLEDRAKTDSVRFETGIAVFDSNMVELYKDIREFTVKDTTDPHIWKNLFIDEFEIPLIPHQYNIAIHARVTDGHKLNGWRFKYPVPPTPRGRLSCSSLKLAFDVSPKTVSESRHRENLKIIPNPTKRFKNDEPLFAYFEIYNLTYDPQGNTEYTLTFVLQEKKEKQNLFDRITGIFGGQKGYKVSVENTVKGTERTVADYISFDMSKLKKGEYELILRIKDRVSGDDASASADFELR